MAGEFYDGDEGIAIVPPKASPVKADYRLSDSQILDVDDNAPELGDLDKGKATKSSEKTEDLTVKLDDENNILSDDDEPEPPKKTDEPETTPETDEKSESEKDKSKAKKPTAEEETEPLTPVKVSEELKAHFADPKVGRELRNAYYAAQAYREVFPSIEDARQIASMFPTLEDAQQAQRNYESFSELQTAFSSDPKTFVKRLSEEGEGEFGAVVEAMMAELPRLSSKSYDKVAQNILVSYLQSIHADADEISGLRGGDPENLRNAADVIAMNLFGGRNVSALTDKPDAKDARIKELEAQLATKDGSQSQARLQTFAQDVDSYINKQLDTQISGAIDSLLAADNYTLNDHAKKEIASRITSEVFSSLQSNKALRLELDRMAKSKDNDFGSAYARRTAALALKAANLEVKKAAAKIVPEWTKGILQLQQNRTNQQTRQASRQEVPPSSGSKGVGPSVPLRPEMIDYRRTSDEDLLEDTAVLKRR